MPDPAPNPNARAPEIVIGLVGPIGTNFQSVSDALERSLSDVAYTASTIRVVQLLHEFPGLAALRDLKGAQRYDGHIEAARRFCEQLKDPAALAVLACLEIKTQRRRAYEESIREGMPVDDDLRDMDDEGDNLAGGVPQAAGLPLEARSLPPDDNRPKRPTRYRHAYILRSLKRPEEVNVLRKIYGPNFLLVAAHTPRELRVNRLAAQFADENTAFDSRVYRYKAEKLVDKDEREEDAKGFGQNVRDTFPMADYFVDASAPVEGIDRSIRRFVELLFEHPFHTPTREEYGMAQARMAALRSADLSRQVGAAITTPEGDVIALGMNDVPCARGGQYWSGDEDDRRDFLQGNTSYELRTRVIGEVLNRLSSMGWLQPSKSELAKTDLKKLVDAALQENGLKDTRIMDAIEFGRTVHAEMAAVLDAARRGAAVKGCVMFTTTFPCHDCARHVVAAGITKVVFIEPYPKSLAGELFSDSIAIDDPQQPIHRVNFVPFAGVSPDRYLELFAAQPKMRRGPRNAPTRWDAIRKSCKPRLNGLQVPYVYMQRELSYTNRFLKAMEPFKGALEIFGPKLP